MEDEVKNKVEEKIPDTKDRSDVKKSLKSSIISDKRKLILYSELLKPKF